MALCFLDEPEQATPQIKTPYPLRVAYLYSKYCNLKCRHCWINPPYSGERTVRPDEISLDELISALEECRQLGMNGVKISGGEPFTRSDIFDLLEYIKEKKLGLTIETNAIVVREKEAKALREAGASQVAVSIDGSTAEIHESLRGVKGSFSDTLEGVKWLKREGLNVQIIASLWRGNRDHLKSTIVLAKALGANSVKINPINSISRAENMHARNEALSVREVIEFHNRLMQELKDEPPMNVTFDLPPAFYTTLNPRLKRICTCGIFYILGILGDGRLSICGIGSSAETLILGRIGRDKIKDIWLNHPVLKEIREGVPSKMEGICARCIVKHYCIGKCRAEAYYTDGSLMSPLKFCQTAYEEGLFPESRLIKEDEKQAHLQKQTV